MVRKTTEHSTILEGHFTVEKVGHFAVEWWGQLRVELVGHYPCIIQYIHDEMRAIMERWGNKPGNPDDYIFPVLNGCKTAIEKENSRATHQRMTNKTLNKIGKTLKFDVRLVLNLARHSFATHLKLSGTPTSFITDALGHSSSKTTEHYLKTIPDQKYKEISDSLLNFK